MPSGNGASWWRTTRGWFALLLSAVIAVNAGTFWKIEQITSTQRHGALSRADTADFIGEVFTSNHSRSRFDLYAVLGRFAPESSYVLVGLNEDSARLTSFSLFSLSAASGVTRRDVAVAGFEPESVPGAVVVATGHGGSGGPPWSILVDSSHGAVEADWDPDDLSQVLMVPGSSEPAPPMFARTFVVLVQDPTPVGTGPTLLVVEQSLILEASQGHGAP